VALTERDTRGAGISSNTLTPRAGGKADAGSAGGAVGAAGTAASTTADDPSEALHLGDGAELDVAAVPSQSSIAASSEEELAPVSLRPAGASILKRPGPGSGAGGDGHGPSSSRGLNVRFNEVVTVRRTWAKRDYDRKVRAWRSRSPRACVCVCVSVCVARIVSCRSSARLSEC
jgi:hypothetical protein